jgi:hypothetical protein
MPPPLPGTVVRTHVELARMWRALMGRDGFGTSSLWLIFFDAESKVQSIIVPIDDIPPEPDERFVHNLAEVVDRLIDDAAVDSVALLLSRPGHRAMTDADRRWARALRAELGEHAVWPIHLATRNEIQVFAPDDLVAAS